MYSEQLKTARRRIANTREELNNTTLQQPHERMSPEQLGANDLAKIRGASSWLTTLPLKSGNFDLIKREFYDAHSLRYHWTPKYLPSTCPCGKRFDVNHAMSCMKGGFVHRRHDDVQDLFASLFKDVCNDVEVESHLQPLTGEVLISSANSSDEARLDVIPRFWERGQHTFFDARVFNPFSKSQLNQKLDTAFSSNENEKKRHYNQRIIEVEHGSFSPLVFSPYGENGREGKQFLNKLAQKLCDKKQMDYSIVIHWLRAKLCFNLLRSAVLCANGSRTTYHELNTDFSGPEIANVIGKIKQTRFKHCFEHFPPFFLPKTKAFYFRYIL